MEAPSYLVGPVRTPHGRFGGSLRDVRVVDLGAHIGRAALDRAGVDPDRVDEVIVANCRQAGNGPNPGRQIALKAGIPERVPANTINMACASGLKILDHAVRAIAVGASDVVLTVAAESMSTMPYLASYRLRWEGVRGRDIELVDGWRDGGTDPICGLNMGQTAENVARTYDIAREDQDEWALQSHRRVTAAWEEGRYDDEAVPVDLPAGQLSRDETHRPDTSREKIAALRPVFEEDGTVTAGNSSQMADGAAAMLVAGEDAVDELDLPPSGRLVSFAAVGVDPTHMGVGPTVAVPLALERAGLTETDVDLFEINEAFASQIVQNVRELKLDPDRVNVNGGGIALGHPTGQSGSRIVVTLLHELARRGGRYGIASLCVGGGQGVAAVFERIEA